MPDQLVALRLLQQLQASVWTSLIPCTSLTVTIEVCYSSLHVLDIVSEHTQTTITLGTQQTSNLPGLVVVIHTKSSTSYFSNFLADSTTAILSIHHGIILSHRQTLSRFASSQSS